MRDDKLGYGRLALAMWPLRASLASWRRVNINSDWDNALSDILMIKEEKNPPPSIRNSVQNVLSRLEMLTSGHEDCPTPSNIEELIIWWKTPPPK